MFGRSIRAVTHARILGDVHHADLYLLTDIPTEPSGVLPCPISLWLPTAAYAIRPEPGRAPADLEKRRTGGVRTARGAGDPQDVRHVRRCPLLSVRLSDVSRGRMGAFHVYRLRSLIRAIRSVDTVRTGWWLPRTTRQWAFPRELEADGRRHAGTQWYAGQVIPGQVTTTHRYEFDPQAAELAVRGADGTFGAARSSGPGLDPGVWSLAVRLRGDWWEVAFIPVMRIVVAADGVTTYEVYEGALDSALDP